jgi:hypothetical protein
MKRITIALLFLLGSVLILPAISFANADISRFFGLAGFAQSASKSAEAAGTVRTEGPLGCGFGIDHSYRGPYFFVAEHMRSIAGASTAVGLTGAGIKFYPWLAPLQFKARNTERVESASLFYQGYAVYFGGTMGFAQASIPSLGDKMSSLAAGIYINGKAGVDYPLSQNWGLRSEFNYSMSIFGAGQIQHLNVLVGAFLDL